MILQHLVKREFQPVIWNQGSLTFRDGRVQDVSFHKPWVMGIIYGKPASVVGSWRKHIEKLPRHEVTFQLHRDGVRDGQCSCSGSKCEHLAALIIWWLARGSLLRAGIVDEDEGALETVLPPKGQLSADLSAKAKEKSLQPVKSTIETEPVLFVHFVERDDQTLGISAEPALRYEDPIRRKERVEMVRSLHRQAAPYTWKNVQGFTLTAVTDHVPVLGSVDAPRLTHMGQAGVQFLGKALQDPDQKHVVLDSALNVKLNPNPLKLLKFEIGERHSGKRALQFYFSNGEVEMDSDDLRELANHGRLSPEFAWKEDILYQFEMPLSVLARHINRSGLNVLESIGMKPAGGLQGLSELDDENEHPLHPIAVYRLSLELGAVEFSVDPTWIEFHEWKKDFEKKTIPKLPKVSFGFDLREYQANGLSWIWSLYHRSLSAFLADDMGLGKTHQVLAFLSSIYCHAKFRPAEPSIVVAPTSVVTAWQQKLERYPTGLRWVVYHGSKRELPATGKADLVLTTYGILQRDTVLREKQWHVAIADESQAMKNANTSTSRISRALKAKFRIAMTGTPVENSSTDLWSVLEFLLPGYLGSQARFKRLYGTKSELLSAEKSQVVKKLVSPFLLRRTKQQVLKELPEKIEEVIFCDLTQRQRSVYNDYLRSQEVSRLRESLQDEKRKVDYTGILALLTKLKQVCDHPDLPELTGQTGLVNVEDVDPNGSGKWEALEEIISEALGSQLKVVIFTQFLSMIDLLKAWSKRQGIEYAELRGETRNRGEVLNRFRDDPNCKLFLCSLMAGGLGIDLTSASVCIHFDRWWNPARENQATDRLHRIGQTRGVQVFKFQIPGTVEDRIASIIERKVALSGSLIEDSSLGLKAFSRTELLELLNELAGT